MNLDLVETNNYLIQSGMYTYKFGITDIATSNIIKDRVGNISHVYYHSFCLYRIKKFLIILSFREYNT